MPILPPRTKHGTSMSGTVHITTRLVGHRIMLLVSIRPHRIIGHINTIGIDIEFRSRSTVLHIVFPIMLRQPRPLNISAQYSIRMVFTETFPAMFRHIQIEEFFRFSLLDETPVLVQFHSPDRIHIGRTPEHIRFTVIVNKQIGILQIMQNCRNSFPVS